VIRKSCPASHLHTCVWKFNLHHGNNQIKQAFPFNWNGFGRLSEISYKWATNRYEITCEKSTDSNLSLDKNCFDSSFCIFFCFLLVSFQIQWCSSFVSCYYIDCSLEFVFFSAVTLAFHLFTRKLCLQFSGLRMRSFTLTRFPIKTLLFHSLLTPIVESTWLFHINDVPCSVNFAQESVWSKRDTWPCLHSI